jgi:crotonobetainyl-CoA:carnitine CoA-transferase CaiB-like acyl-CoA transferase
MMLADMGATVIKVEQPEGDTTRALGPYLNQEDRDMGLGGFNSSVNRNKKSIALNLKDPAAQKIAQRLACECDALILNFSTPKIMEKYNLDYDTIKELNPRLVYVSISGYGTARIVPSLHEGKPTIDLMMQAESGAMSITGSSDGQIYKTGPGIGDSYAGTVAVVAMLAALLKAKETGKGQFVDIAMLDSMIMLSERIIYQYAYTGKSPGPIGNRHPLYAPYSLYPTKDGSIVISSEPSRYWDRLVEAVDNEVFREPRFATKEARLENQDELDQLLGEWTSQFTNAQAVELLDKHGCLVAPVNRAEDLFNSEHVALREMLVEVEGHPRTKQKVKIVGTPFKFSDNKARIYRRAPLVGEDSAAIMGQLGYAKAEIDTLTESGAIVSTTL